MKHQFVYLTVAITVSLISNPIAFGKPRANDTRTESRPGSGGGSAAVPARYDAQGRLIEGTGSRVDVVREQELNLRQGRPSTTTPVNSTGARNGRHDFSANGPHNLPGGRGGNNSAIATTLRPVSLDGILDAAAEAKKIKHGVDIGSRADASKVFGDALLRVISEDVDNVMKQPAFRDLPKDMQGQIKTDLMEIFASQYKEVQMINAERLAEARKSGVSPELVKFDRANMTKKIMELAEVATKDIKDPVKRAQVLSDGLVYYSKLSTLDQNSKGINFFDLGMNKFISNLKDLSGKEQAGYFVLLANYAKGYREARNEGKTFAEAHIAGSKSRSALLAEKGINEEDFKACHLG